MKKVLLMLASFSLLIPVLAKADALEGYYMKQQTNAMFHLVGKGTATQRAVPGFTQTETWCFDNLRIIDPLTNIVLGKATDCVSQVTPDAAGNIDVVGTTYFYLPSGTLIIQGGIRLAPVGPTMGGKTLNGMNVTHITGASTDQITSVKGFFSTGAFNKAIGNGRLSGMVDMSQFTFNEGDEVAFSCFFHLNYLKDAGAVDSMIETWPYPDENS